MAQKETVHVFCRLPPIRHLSKLPNTAVFAIKGVYLITVMRLIVKSNFIARLNQQARMGYAPL